MTWEGEVWTSIELDVDDCLHEASDDALMSEVKDRNLLDDIESSELIDKLKSHMTLQEVFEEWPKTSEKFELMAHLTSSKDKDNEE